MDKLSGVQDQSRLLRGCRNCKNYPELERVFKWPVQFIGGENPDYLKFECHVLIRKYFPESRIAMLKSLDIGRMLNSQMLSKKK